MLVITCYTPHILPSTVSLFNVHDCPSLSPMQENRVAVGAALAFKGNRYITKITFILQYIYMVHV